MVAGGESGDRSGSAGSGSGALHRLAHRLVQVRLARSVVAVVAAVNLAAVTAWVAARGLNARGILTQAPAAIPVFAGYLVAFLAIRLGLRYLREKTWKTALTPLPRQALDGALSVGLVALASLAYAYTKLFLPGYNPILFDGALAAVDRFLFRCDTTAVLLDFFSRHRSLAAFFDVQYIGFLPVSSLAAAWWITDENPRDRAAFAAGFAALWMVGAWLYAACPAVGPALLSPDLFRRVEAVFPFAAEVEGGLMENYRRTLALLHTGRALPINIFAGIAAMPSLHVAVDFFLWLWARGRSRSMALFFALFTAMTFLGSVATGWHYAVDGVAGVLLAWLVYVLVRPRPPVPG